MDIYQLGTGTVSLVYGILPYVIYLEGSDVYSDEKSEKSNMRTNDWYR